MITLVKLPVNVGKIFLKQCLPVISAGNPLKINFAACNITEASFVRVMRESFSAMDVSI